MRKRKRRLVAAAAVALCLIFPILYQAGGIGGRNADLPPLAPAAAMAMGEEIPFGGEDWIAVGKNEKLAMYMRPSDGNFYVETASGAVWHANPLDAMSDACATRVYRMELASSLIVSYYDLKDRQTVKKNSEAACVKKKSVAFYDLENGFRADYRFADAGITIPVEVALAEDHLRVRIVTANILEENRNRYLLASVCLLPNFASGGAAEEGYILVPDGEGALMRFNNGKGAMSEYQAYVYGDNLSATSLFRPVDAYRASLPLFGISRNGSAMLSVITGGDALARLTAAPSMKKSTYCSAYAEYMLRFSDQYTLDESSLTAQRITLYQQGEMEASVCEQRYYFLEGEQADYAGMAACYRDYLLACGGAKAREPEQTEVFLDFYGAVARRESIIGVPVTLQRRLSGLRDVEAAYQALRDAAPGKLRLRMMRWSADALKGRVDTAPAWAAGNGWDAWEALRQAMAVNGDTASLSVELALFSAGGNGFSPTRDSAQALSKSPAFQYQYLFSTRMRNTQAKRSYLLHPALLARAADRAAAALAAHQVDSVSVLTLPSVRYGSYGDRLAGTEQTRIAAEDALRRMERIGDCVLDDVNAFALPMTDFAVNLPDGSSRFDAMDETVPFLQMVYGGLVKGYAGRPVNLSDSPEKMLLHAIATGEALHFSLITGDPEMLIETDLNFLYSAQADAWLTEIIRMAQEAHAAHVATGYSRLVGHAVLAPGITRSVFENGAEICVNTTERAYLWQGKEVPPMSWRVAEVTAE